MAEEKKDVAVKAERLEEQLKEWGVDLEKLKSRANKAKADVKTEIDREVSTLRAKLNDAFRCEGRIKDVPRMPYRAARWKRDPAQASSLRSDRPTGPGSSRSQWAR
jgi:hypothetical protein